MEIKIYAGYGDDQVGRYLRSLRSTVHGVVVAVTRDVPRSGESVIDTRWAGSVQWSTILPDLRRLRPIDPELAAQWPLFLDVLETEGDMGFTKANPELFQAWANYPIARQHLMEFLDTMRRALLDELRVVLVGPDEPLQAAADFATKGKSERGVVAPLGKVYVGFRVPAGGTERLWVGVWGGDGQLYLNVDVAYLVASSDRRRTMVEGCRDLARSRVRELAR